MLYFVNIKYILIIRFNTRSRLKEYIENVSLTTTKLLMYSVFENLKNIFVCLHFENNIPSLPINYISGANTLIGLRWVLIRTDSFNQQISDL